MEASTTIRQMVAGNKIFVPSYQSAYSWETEIDSSKQSQQVNVFLLDLEDYNESLSETPYYFGHFLFEDKSGYNYALIDGQQRLTTIITFLSSLFTQLKLIRALTDEENEIFEDIVKRNSTYRLSTVDYDNTLFRDYVINQYKKDHNGLETESAKRIVKAYDFFTDSLSNKEENYLTRMLETISNASCSTYLVKNESEAIQMFIFQNNRGKKPSNLEITKAQFMYNVHLYGGEDREDLIEEIKQRFERIYKSISSIEYQINEDDVLVYTLRVYFNSLNESNSLEKINKILSEDESVSFIKSFSHLLSVSFEYLTVFFGKDANDNVEIHSLITLGGIGIAIPFIIKSYKFGLSKSLICELCKSLESLILRNRIIGTRADIVPRINDVYQEFTEENQDTDQIVGRIEWMKTIPDQSWWFAYWNNSKLKKSMEEGVHRSTAKYILWKYENHLLEQGKKGYTFVRYDAIIDPELEHIAPQTENPASGYCEYDEEFRQYYIDCLGNYLLISKSHNCSIGNIPFEDKRNSYNYLAQQREIQKMTTEIHLWSKENIDQRHDKIVDFIMNTF